MIMSNKSQATADQGFQWTTQHSKILLVSVLAFLIVGGGYTAVQVVQENKEQALQSELFTIEKQYQDKKQEFAEAENPPPRDPNDKTPQPVRVKATGDLEKDYGTVVTQLTDFAQKNIGSRAGQMAALQASEIYRKYKKPEMAEQALKPHARSPKGLLDALVQLELGKTLADQNKCDQAIPEWEKLVGNTKFDYVKPTALLQQGLCYESLQQKDMAEMRYKEVKDLDPAGPTGRQADQLIKFLKTTAN